MQVQSPETQSKLAVWRQKAAQGISLSMEEMKEAIQLLRADRRSAADAPKASKAKSPARSSADMLGELEGL